MSKKNLVLSIGLAVLTSIAVSFTIIIYLVNFAEPQVIIKASIEPITPEDYERIQERKDMAPYGIDKFRHININLEFKQPLLIIKDRKIDTGFLNDIDKILSSDERIMDLSGGGFEQDNKSESKAIYQRNKEILLKDISQEELADLFNDMNVKVEWRKVLKGEEKRVYYIKDYLSMVD